MRVLGVTTALLAVAGCTSPAPDPGPAAPRYEVVRMVVSGPRGGPRICVGSIADTRPPRCGELPVEPFSWDDVEGEQTVNGVTWLDHVRLVGTYDGATFRLTEKPVPSTWQDPGIPPSGLPCPAPKGGWRVVDPGRVREADLDAAARHARRAPDRAGTWTYDLGPRRTVLVLAFTGDLVRHERAARERWGGPLCVVRRLYSYAALTRAEERVNAGQTTDDYERGTYWAASVHESANGLVVRVLLDDEATRRETLRRARGVPVRLLPVLRPVGGTSPSPRTS